MPQMDYCKWTLSVLAGLLFALAPLCSAADGTLAPSSTVTGSLKDVKPDFFRRIKALADTGNLFDVKSASEMLGIDFITTESEKQPQPPRCSDIDVTQSFKVTTATTSGPTWYRTLPTGEHHMELPAAGINPAATVGDAKLGYTITRHVLCNDAYNLQDHTNAEIMFGGLPSFACITPATIRAMLPESRAVLATEGITLYSYSGKVTDGFGIELVFTFRPGADCAVYVQLKQDQNTGLRFRRAQAKHLNCKALASKDFCATHSPIGWDSSAQVELEHHVAQVCPSIDYLAKQDREQGTQPVPWPKMNFTWPRPPGGPCTRYPE
ncbi:hypothetical protein JYK21_13480 [Ralstonia pickettii]|nr:hypothetical protein [Ralstonia pickettii]